MAEFAQLYQMFTHKLNTDKQRQLDREKFESDKEQQKAELELRKQQIAEQAKQHGLAVQAADRLFKLKSAIETQDLAKKIADTGITPAGASVSPAAQTKEGYGYTPINPAQATSQMVILPDMGTGQQQTVQVPTREAEAQKQASLERITGAPAEEARTRIAQAVEADRAKREAANKELDYQRAMMQKLIDDQRNDKKIASDMKIAQMRDATDRYIAQMRKGDSDIDLTPYAQQALDGDITRNDVLRLPISKPDKMKLIGAVTNAGGNFLTDKQKELVGFYSQMVSAVDLMDQFIAQQPKTHNYLTSKVGGALSTIDTNLRGLEDELAGRQTIIAKGFARETGNASDRDMQKAAGLLPSRFSTVEVNMKKRNDYVQELNKVFKDKLQGLNSAQQQNLMNKVGLTKYGVKLTQTPVQPKSAVGVPANGVKKFKWTPEGLVAEQ